MATYKVWLTTKDIYGNTKEIDGGNIDIDLAKHLSPEDLSHIEEALPLEDYLKKAEIDYLATDIEVEHAIQKNETIKYADFELADEGSTN